MAQNTEISWTHHSANLWWGCTAVHEGCKNCYAEILSKRCGNDLWGNDKPRREIKSVWSDLDKYQKLAAKAGEMHRVFVGSMMDIFEKPMPLINSKGELDKNQNTGNLRFHLFYRIDRGDYSNLMFLFLTKRPSNINKYIFESWKENPPKNVMFGTSPVNQKTYDKLVPQLLQVKGKIFLSIEPQLDLIRITGKSQGISWIIQGGESGHNRRPFDLEWARSLKKECEHFKIPYFFKQIDKVYEKKYGIPEDLQIQQFTDFENGICYQPNFEEIIQRAKV